MIVTYQFSCAYPGCKVFVLSTLHMHDDHTFDLEKLGEAMGFCRFGDPNSFSADRWQCLSHRVEVEGSK
jgi:hypothetical protein